MGKLKQFLVVCILACCVYFITLFNRQIIRLLPAQNVSQDKIAPAKHGMMYFHSLEPKCKMKPISIAEAVEQHHAKTLSTCDNTCPDTDPVCNTTTYNQWIELDPNKIHFLPFLKECQYIFPWEKEYLSQPPLNDAQTLPSPNLSLVKIDSSRFINETVSCTVGDFVYGRLFLKDYYGDQRTMGGDEVRVWISNSKGFAAAGSVQDLNNGTYLFSFRCIWPGYTKQVAVSLVQFKERAMHVLLQKLNIAVTYPREFLRTVFQQSLAGVTQYLLGLFKNGEISEATVCSPTPNVPGRPCICNITSFQRFPHYCGRPKDKRLTCDHYFGTSSINVPKARGVTRAELALISKVTGPALKNAIRHKVKVLVKYKDNLSKLEPCNTLNASMTWNAKTPHGYLSPGYKWNELQCKRPEMTYKFTKQCLRNTTVMFFGDSNARQMFEALRVFARCKQTSYWPKIINCRNEKDDITLNACPHEYPLILRTNFFPKPEHKDIPSQLDELTSSRKYMIYIHYYFHYTYYHFSSLIARVDAVKEALVCLLKRNPNVVVGIRGPHISTRINDRNHAVGGDNLAPFYKKILAKKFKSLQNRVFFLDGWEMTVAAENEEYHPHRKIQTEIVLTLMAHNCP